jgi:hypothetical protein
MALRVYHKKGSARSRSAGGEEAMETQRAADDIKNIRLLRHMVWLGCEYVRLWFLWPKIERTARLLWERNASIQADFPAWRDWLRFFGRNDECRAYIDGKLTGRDRRHAVWLIKRHAWLRRQSAKLDRMEQEMCPSVRRYRAMRAARHRTGDRI